MPSEVIQREKGDMTANGRYELTFNPDGTADFRVEARGKLVGIAGTGSSRAILTLIGSDSQPFQTIQSTVNLGSDLSGVVRGNDVKSGTLFPSVVNRIGLVLFNVQVEEDNGLPSIDEVLSSLGDLEKVVSDLGLAPVASLASGGKLDLRALGILTKI